MGFLAPRPKARTFSYYLVYALHSSFLIPQFLAHDHSPTGWGDGLSKDHGRLRGGITGPGFRDNDPLLGEKEKNDPDETF